MNKNNVKVGMKVVPHSKSVGRGNLEDLPYKNFMYVTEICNDWYYPSTYFCLSNRNEPLTTCSNFFLASDFEPYLEPEKEIVSGYPVAYCDQFCYYIFA